MLVNTLFLFADIMRRYAAQVDQHILPNGTHRPAN
jgi:hypothetical protein